MPNSPDKISVIMGSSDSEADTLPAPRELTSPSPTPIRPPTGLPEFPPPPAISSMVLLSDTVPPTDNGNVSSKEKTTLPLPSAMGSEIKPKASPKPKQSRKKKTTQEVQRSPTPQPIPSPRRSKKRNDTGRNSRKQTIRSRSRRRDSRSRSRRRSKNRGRVSQLQTPSGRNPHKTSHRNLGDNDRHRNNRTSRASGENERSPKLKNKITVLAMEIEASIAMRSDFTRTRDDEILSTAESLISNGIESMTELKITPKRNRDYLIEDLRRNGIAYVKIRFLLQLFDAFPCAPKNVSGATKIDIEEICIPRELRKFKIDLPNYLRYGVRTRQWLIW